MNDTWFARHRQMVALSALMVVTALVLRAYTFNSTGLDWDESLYIVIAQRWLAGGVPYKAVWDQHPMGLPALFALAEALIGDGLLAARILCLIAVAGTAVLLARFMIRFAGSPVAGAIAGLCYLFYMTRPEGLAANTECFNNLAVTAGAYLLLGQMREPAGRVSGGTVSPRVACIAGLLFGIGLQLKYVVLPEAALLCLAVLAREWLQGAPRGRVFGVAAVMIVSGLTPTILMTLYFWWAGALPDYLAGNISTNLRYIETGPSPGLVLLRIRFGLLPLIGLLIWPFVLLWQMHDTEARRRHGLLAFWLALWLLAAAIDVALPMKLWKHYFNAIIPPLCLMVGLCSISLARKRGVLAVLLAATLIPAVFSIVKHFPDSRGVDRLNVPRALADDIRRGGSDGHDVFVFNYDALVYAYANATPPTKYVLGIDLAEFSGLTESRPEQEIGRVLATSPRWIVVADPSPYIHTPQVRRELDDALRRYQAVAAYPESDYIQPPITVRLYELKADAAARGARPAEAAGLKG